MASRLLKGGLKGQTNQSDRPVPWAPVTCLYMNQVACGVSFQPPSGVLSLHAPRLARSKASYFAGIFARFRAMASSTAFSCFNSSSRRDSVLLGLFEPAPNPGTGGLPVGAAAPLPDDLGGGDRGRFLRKVNKLLTVVTSLVGE